MYEGERVQQRARRQTAEHVVQPERLPLPEVPDLGRARDIESAPRPLHLPEHEPIGTILREQGFPVTDFWMRYAREHGFRRVHARRLVRCPDCCSESRRSLGQYVFYSHLARLLECACGLIYSDLRLEPETVRRHFEGAYKAEDYFCGARGAINDQLAELVAEMAPRGGRVLDVGGATGTLMALLRRARSDLRVTVCDVSEEACRRAAERGLRTLCSDIPGLARVGESYHVVVLSDVLYYEPRISEAWERLGAVVAENGILLLRLPNKATWIRGVQRLRGPWEREAQARVGFYNPEHLYIFTPAYLRERLRRAGFPHVRARPARALRKSGWRGGLVPLIDAGAETVYRLTARRLVLSPSRIYVARRVIRSTSSSPGGRPRPRAALHP